MDGSIYVFKIRWEKPAVKRHFQVKKRVGEEIDITSELGNFSTAETPRKKNEN